MDAQDMTAKRFLEVVMSIRREAWPHRITGWHPDGYYWELETVPPGPVFKANVWIDFVHASEKFESAGLNYLVNEGHAPDIRRSQAGRAIDIGVHPDRVRYEAPTLIEAIAAAVKGAKT